MQSEQGKIERPMRQGREGMRNGNKPGENVKNGDVNAGESTMKG
jgi:hypothetical protein